MTRVLVTGGTGFVGRQAVESLLRAGHEVHVSTRGDGVSRGIDQRVVVHRVDLLKDESARLLVVNAAPEAVLHLAWCVEPGRFWTDRNNLDWVAASLRLARASEAAHVRRFVSVGTCYEYDWPPGGHCIEGVTSLRPHTLYDAAKAGLSAILRSYFSATGVQFAWGRLFFLYGAGEDARRFVAGVAQALAWGRQARCTLGAQVRDFLDTRDAGAALAALLESDYCGDVNIGSGDPVRLRDVAARMAEIAGRPDLLEMGALPDRPGEPPFILADTRTLRQHVGFRPTIDLDVGLRELIEYWRSRAP